MERNVSELDLPGFRFQPTEEELLDFYLRKVVLGKKLHFDIIGTLNLYRYDPWELPGKLHIYHEYIHIFFLSKLHLKIYFSYRKQLNDL